MCVKEREREEGKVRGRFSTKCPLESQRQRKAKAQITVWELYEVAFL